ncbi:type IV secretion system DNA-binding domain-containing protein [Bradyrhizobium sp.]|nr:type IV secretion system DNA-binding domain-containing protein [Bradyrhizobium sp.]
MIGGQDAAQIRADYRGQDQAKSWFGTTGTKIITASTPALRPRPTISAV